jgi:hypothetical protein
VLVVDEAVEEVKVVVADLLKTLAELISRPSLMRCLQKSVSVILRRDYVSSA